MEQAPAPTVQRLPSWGRQVSFFQRHQPAFWLFIVLLIFTSLAVLNEQLLYLDVFPAGWMFSIFLLTLYVVPVALAIYFLDLFEREPLSLLIAAFVWGGVIAIGLSGPTNGAVIEILSKLGGVRLAQEWGAALAAPPVEELFKFLGMIVIFLIARYEIDGIFDGFIYGAMVGLGFAAVENVQYFVGAIASSGGGDQIGPVLQMFFLRAIVVGAYMHVLWSGIAGIGLGYYATRHDQPHSKRLLVMLGLFALAVVAHFIWNSPLLAGLVGEGLPGQILFGLIKGSPFFIFLGLMVLLAQRREHHWFKVATEGHVEDDVLTPQELAELGGLRSRWRARRQAGQRKGPQGAKLMGRLQREQINLAMIRTRTHSDEHPDILAQRELIRGVRAELQALPDVAAPAGGAMPAAFQAPPPPAAHAWTPTHQVPATGMAAWDVPDPSRPPVVTLAAGLPLRVFEQAGAWSRVVASNGWQGWVDGRLLVPLS
ncbi:MAG TPA: PrsW family glutamic-type intramembrane protease [Candidatus Limnocylindria bacterium]|nr:PrsW family glutamic-type intramembrane protease [Candidatus Limnocylindria bacterium]